MALKSVFFAAGAAALLSSTASAQQYVSASAGFNFQADSDNAGAFTRDFVTGDGVAVPAGTILPAGTTVGWTTEFETGLFAAAAYGWRFADTFRIEAELSYASADVDTHVGVQAGGGALGAADAAVLITGSPALGVTVADLVADGQGDISSSAMRSTVITTLRSKSCPSIFMRVWAWASPSWTLITRRLT
jgi:hypothetical protein